MSEKKYVQWLKKSKTILMGFALSLLPASTPNANSSLNIPNRPKIPSELTAKNLKLPKRATESQKILFIGDSRTVGMYTSLTKEDKNPVNDTDQNGNMWFAKVGEDTKWLKNNIDTIQNKAKECNTIVINLGVNDIAKNGGKGLLAAQNFVSYTNELAEQWIKEGKTIFVSSCNPVSSKYTSIPDMNTQIDIYNAYLEQNLNPEIRYIDTNSYVKECATLQDYTPDGLHYQPQENSDIYDFICQSLTEKQTDRYLANTTSEKQIDMAQMLTEAKARTTSHLTKKQQPKRSAVSTKQATIIRTIQNSRL